MAGSDEDEEYEDDDESEDAYEDDDEDEDEDEDDEEGDEEESGPRGRRPRTTLGDPMAAQNSVFYSRKKPRPPARRPAASEPPDSEPPEPEPPSRRASASEAPATKPGGGSRGGAKRKKPARRRALDAGTGVAGQGAAADVGGTSAIRRVQEKRRDEAFRSGFIRGVVTGVAVVGAVIGVMMLSDSGASRRQDSAKRELERAEELLELGDITRAEFRLVEISSLLAGPGDAESQLERAAELLAAGTITEAEFDRIKVAAYDSGDGEITSVSLRKAATKADPMALKDRGVDEFTNDKKSNITKADVEALNKESMVDGRDMGIGDLAKIQRQNRGIMRKAKGVAKTVTGKEMSAGDAKRAAEAMANGE